VQWLGCVSLRVLVAVYAGWDHPAKLAFDQVLAGGSCATALDELDKLPALRISALWQLIRFAAFSGG